MAEDAPGNPEGPRCLATAEIPEVRIQRDVGDAEQDDGSDETTNGIPACGFRVSSLSASCKSRKIDQVLKLEQLLNKESQNPIQPKEVLSMHDILLQ